jgi:two-component system sensor histidine kinase CiaH
MYKTKRIRLIIIVYWFLLIYIVAALVWWFISLQQQNNKMTDLLLNELQAEDPAYNAKAQRILNDKKRKTAQYIGEGTTFLALILIGAVFVYRATRRQLRLSMQQQNFMMAVTHELKTPIAVVRLNLETLQKRKLEEVQQQRMLGISLQEVNRLNSLCNNILLASQLEAGEYKASKNDVNFSALAVRVVSDFSLRFPNRNIIAEVEEDIIVTGEELLLELLITNLVENAIKYSSKDAPVKVVLAQKEECVQMQVIDEGPGIDEEEREKIFEKFYRIGNEETRSAKGTGLGLYLCRQIAKQHEATIRVTPNQPKGSVFTVTFNQ